MRMMDDDMPWSAAGRLMAACAFAEIGVALLVIINPGFHGPWIFIGAAGVVLPSVLTIALCTMPVQMKGVLIMLISAALLGLSAALDPFGLRAVDTVIRDADHHDVDPGEPAQAAAATSAQSASAVRIKAAGDGDAASVAQDITEEIRRKGDFRADAAHVDGLVSVAKAADGPSYRLTWQIEKSGSSLWCGRIVTTGQKREEAVQSLSSAMLAAVSRSRGGDLSCAG